MAASMRTVYLIIYNVSQAIGWTIALYQCVAALASTGKFSSVYERAGNTVGEGSLHSFVPSRSLPAGRRRLPQDLCIHATLKPNAFLPSHPQLCSSLPLQWRSSTQLWAS